jgi:hypothetical protein
MAVKISGVFIVDDVSKIFIFADYVYDNGATVGFSDYTVGFNDRIWLNYLDKVA